jgi:ribosomal protein S18 acetylase RimI-like enzyme
MDVDVRAAGDLDRAELMRLFARAGEGSPSASLWGDATSEAAIYLTPYLDLEPASAFVAMLDGRPVGYLVGCVDGASFPTEEERMSAVLGEARLFRRREVRRFFARATLDLARARLRRQETAGDVVDPRWPSHLHVNVAPEGRGTGAAQALMARWNDRLEAASSPGCHLQTLVENARAVAFFRAEGFRPYGPTPLVPGVRYQRARVHQLTMVRPGP